MILKNQILHRRNNKPIVWDAFFKSNKKPKPLVIFCHGYKGFKDWGSWNLVAKFFCDSDFYFTKFNFSHNGGTIENPIDFPDLDAFAQNNYTKELDDLDAILNLFLSQQFEYKNEIDHSNVIIIGHSRGGGIAIIKAAEDQRITTLITWASISDFANRTATTGDLEQWRVEGVKYVLNSRTHQQMPHYFQFYEDFKRNEKRLNIESAIKSNQIPTLIVHAKDDPSVSFTEAETIHSWNPKTELITIENSNHVFDAAHPWTTDKLPHALEKVIERSIKFIISSTN